MISRAFESHSDAIADLRTIAGHYEEPAFGLVAEFVSAVDEAILHVGQFPYLYPTFDGALRRAILHRFPFGLFYQVTDGCIRVIAIFPLRSNPDDIAHLLTFVRPDRVVAKNRN
jgi:hypothetical protein